MNFIQIFEEAVTDTAEFESGAPVQIQIDPLVTPDITVTFGAGAVAIEILGKEAVSVPLEGASVTLPQLGVVKIASVPNGITLQKGT